MQYQPQSYQSQQYQHQPYQLQSNPSQSNPSQSNPSQSYQPQSYQPQSYQQYNQDVISDNEYTDNEHYNDNNDDNDDDKSKSNIFILLLLLFLINAIIYSIILSQSDVKNKIIVGMMLAVLYLLCILPLLYKAYKKISPVSMGMSLMTDNLPKSNILDYIIFLSNFILIFFIHYYINNDQTGRDNKLMIIANILNIVLYILFGGYIL